MTQQQPQQQRLHPNLQEKSISMYGSCIDGETQEESPKNWNEPNQEMSVISETKNHNNETYRSSRPFNGLFLFGVSLLVLSMMAVVVTYHPLIALSSSSSAAAASTSLSMVAMESKPTTTATANLLIDILQSSSTIIHPQSYYKSKVDEFPSLSIDLERERQVYNGRTTKEQISMTIEWTNGLYHSTSTDILNKNSNDKSIIALLCGDSDSHLYYMDAKTITDAASNTKPKHRLLRRRSLTETEWYYGAKDYFDWWGGSGTIREKTWHTSNSNNNDDTTYEYTHDGNDGVWYIASVPQTIMDQRKCQAVIYYYIRDDEYVVMSKSTIIHIY